MDANSMTRQRSVVRKWHQLPGGELSSQALMWGKGGSQRGKKKQKEEKKESFSKHQGWCGLNTEPRCTNCPKYRGGKRDVEKKEARYAGKDHISKTRTCAFPLTKAFLK